MSAQVQETTHDRAAYYLTLWVRWEARDDHGLGYPSSVPLIASDDRYVSLDDLMDRAEAYAAEVTDACLHSMEPHLRLVIRNYYEASVIRWRRVSEPALLNEAEAALMRRLNQRGMY